MNAQLSVFHEVPQCKPYHPGSELSKMPGYYPNVSIAQLEAVNQLVHSINAEKLNFDIDGEDAFLKLLRFLRARKFNVKNAFTMIKDDVLWRSEQNRINLSKESAQEVLNCNIGEIYRYFPVWFQGFDKQMRPVSYRQFGKFEIWNVLKLTTIERLIRFHAWETEQALRSMYSLSATSGYNIETFVLVIDAAGWNMKLATADAFAFIKGMATTDSDHYPERLGTMVIINAPSVLSFAWRVVQGFLDSVTKEKIKILSTNPEEWQPILQHLIDIDQIPQQYGGRARNLSPNEAIGAMNPPMPMAVKVSAAAEREIAMEVEEISASSRTHGGAKGSEGNMRRLDSSFSSHVGTAPTVPISTGSPQKGSPRRTDQQEQQEENRGTAKAKKAVMVDRAVQTDEDVLVMAEELPKVLTRSSDCAIM